MFCILDASICLKETRKDLKMPIPTYRVAQSKVQALISLLREYTDDPRVISSCSTLAEAMAVGDRDTTLYICSELRGWYKEHLHDILSNQWVQNKDAHRKCSADLDELQTAFETHEEWFRAAQQENISRTYNKKRRVFVSHSSKDIEYVGAFVKLLRNIGLNEDNLFCSSVSGLDVPLGEDIFEFLRRCFTDYELFVIFVISKDNYYSSAACLNEMGAAWVQGTHSVSVLLPGMSPGAMQGAIDSGKHAVVLDSNNARYKLNELRDMILEFLELAPIHNTLWEQDRDEFLQTVGAAATGA